MAAKRLSVFTGGIEAIERRGAEDPLITGITYDSRRARKGSLFFALDGLHTDGRLYVDDAIERGAAAVVCAEIPAEAKPGIVYLRVRDLRAAMSRVSADYFDRPSSSLDVIGVTGTDGKSTTVYLVHQLLSALGVASGFLSTVQILTGDRTDKNPYRQSTPESSEVQAILAEMVTNGKQVAVLEATSHGLSRRTNRLRDVRFRTGVLTNITHEHLEFHGSLEQYVSDKANLFRALDAAEAFGVVNGDDSHADYFRAASPAPVYSYGAASEADLRAVEVRADATGVSFTLASSGRRLPARINLPGLFNVDDTLAAVLAVWKYTGADLGDIVSLLPQLEPAVGRMHVVRRGQSFELIVDYAHTPGAFERLLPAMREQCRGRLFAVFGSGGERDVEKRSIQGRIADEYCDVIVLADEDPRGEEPMELLEQIAAGVTRKRRGEDLLLIPDRLEAIRTVCRMAAAGDTVLLLGKGHESTIIYSDGPKPWNEIEAAERCLSELGFQAPARQ